MFSWKAHSFRKTIKAPKIFAWPFPCLLPKYGSARCTTLDCYHHFLVGLSYGWPLIPYPNNLSFTVPCYLPRTLTTSLPAWRPLLTAQSLQKESPNASGWHRMPFSLGLIPTYLFNLISPYLSIPEAHTELPFVPWTGFGLSGLYTFAPTSATASNILFLSLGGEMKHFLRPTLNELSLVKTSLVAGNFGNSLLFASVAFCI